MSAAASRATPLVVVFLRGGADGLSLLRPLEDDVVESSRPDLVVAAADAAPVGEGFGLHPSMATTARRATEGTVALVPAVGLPAASRSHFSAQFAVEQCNGGDPEVEGGWLGRHLARTGGDEVAPFRAVSLGQPQVPMLLHGAADVLAATSLEDLALGGTRGSGADLLDAATLEGLWSSDAGVLGSSAAAGRRVLEIVADLPGVVGPADDGGTPAPSSAAAQMVSLFGAGLGAEVGMLNLGGWDHHSALGARDGSFQQLTSDLDGVLDTLLNGIPGVTVLVVSEFGRRVAANGSGGSDHGRGGVAIVLGDRVHGGVRGDWPGLSDLDDGDVRIANDVRVVFAEVAEATIGADPEAILPGAPATRLGLLT